MTARLLGALFAVALMSISAAARPPKRATKKPRPSPEVAIGEKFADGLVELLRGKGRFHVDGCPTATPTQWASALLLGDSIPMKYAFAPGCDVEGETVLRREPFPIDLKLRNIPGVERIRANVDAEAKPDWANGVVRAELHFKDATFESNHGGTGPIAFTARVSVATGLDAKAEPGLAGEIRIYKVRGQSVDVRRRVP